jgi:hypothetical protein
MFRPRHGAGEGAEVDAEKRNFEFWILNGREGVGILDI